MPASALCTSLIIVTVFVVALHPSPASAKRKGAEPTAYEVLQSYGFPEGLLPRTVENSGEDYSLDQDSGAFSLHLENSCRFTIPDSYEVRYASKITGDIAMNRLHNLNGISVHIFFVWWNIDAILVSGDDLVFQVGPFSASYPAENFVENPMCATHADL